MRHRALVPSMPTRTRRLASDGASHTSEGGVTERVNVFGFMLWFAAFAAMLLRARSSGGVRP